MVQSEYPSPAATAKFPEVFYARMVEESRDIILLINDAGYVVYANKTALAAYQYTWEEITALQIWDLRAPQLRQEIEQQLRAAWEHGIIFKTLHIRKNRELFAVEVSSSTFSFAQEDYILSVVRDITEISEVKHSLKETTAQYYALSEDFIAAHEELLASEEELRQQFDELLTRDQDIQRKNFLLESLHIITLQLMDRANYEGILQQILVSAAQLAETPHGFIYRLDPIAQTFTQSHGLGHHECCIGQSFPCQQGIAGQVYRTKDTVVANDYGNYKKGTPPPPCLDQTFTAHAFSFNQISALLLAPLKANDQLLGIIGLANYNNGRNFTSDEVQTLKQFAQMASIALDNASLFLSHQAELTERRRTEQELRKTQAANQLLLNSIPDPMFMIDQAGTFLDYKATSDQLILPPEQFIGKNIFDIFPTAIASQALRHIQHALTTQKLQTFEYQLVVGGQTRQFEARIIPSSPTQVLAITRDITERHVMEKQLKYQSMHDSLTSVYNRGYFEEHMKNPTHQPGASIGLLICDVDGLKLINDALGHAAGDTVLRHISSILRQSFTSGDVVARIGGDEFAVLLYGATERNFEDACSHIRRQLDAYNRQNTMFPISLSLGYAVSQQFPADMDTLFKAADTNMYREKLHQKQSAKNSIVQALIKALEARDYLTEGHGDRLQDIVEVFAKSIGLPEHQIADLRLLAHFHDIGKVGIPDHILFKPGPLTPEEWIIMRQHTDIGYRIASSVPDLAPIANWILSHHERWNGQGYPQGLSGEKIPLACRILALADTYDAMTNDRPYRKAASSNEAFAELERFSGTQFDPNLTRKFIEVLSSTPYLR